jgi:hypothetical protein
MSQESLVEILQRMHAVLRPTRGAAVALAEVDWNAGTARSASVGNLVIALVSDGVSKRLPSDNGIVGHSISRFRELSQPCAAQCMLILHSDGLSTSWNLERYPGLVQHDASLIAGVLYRDHSRGRDDALVVVIKRTVT